MEQTSVKFNKHTLIGALLLVFSSPGVLWGSNWQWMKDTEVRSFSEQDWALLDKTITQMLVQGSDGDTQQWQNPETGNSGSVQIQDTRETATGTRLNYCRQPDGQWKIDTRPRQQK